MNPYEPKLIYNVPNFDILFEVSDDVFYATHFLVDTTLYPNSCFRLNKNKSSDVYSISFKQNDGSYTEYIPQGAWDFLKIKALKIREKSELIEIKPRMTIDGKLFIDNFDGNFEKANSMHWILLGYPKNRFDTEEVSEIDKPRFLQCVSEAFGYLLEEESDILILRGRLWGKLAFQKSDELDNLSDQEAQDRLRMYIEKYFGTRASHFGPFKLENHYC